jgi:hypothetical protein
MFYTGRLNMSNFLRKALLFSVLTPSVLTFIGAVSNQLVLIVNHGKFPVMASSALMAKMEPDADGMIDDGHCVMTDRTRLNFLADVFNFHNGIESIGDLLINAGAMTRDWAFFVALLMVFKKRKQSWHCQQ